MSAAPKPIAEAAHRTPRHNPWAVAFTVTMATFMEVLDSSIANVALPHIAGGLSAGIDESTWILTSYLVSNAIVLPISGWLATVLGRKRFYMSCVAIFALSSMLCGFAPTLGTLIMFRVIQGVGGGGLGPSEQAILADTFPTERLGMAFALYGMAVVLAPAIGPTLGGWITDNYNWRWIFFINVPIGMLSLFLSYRMVEDPPHLVEQTRRERASGLNIDYVGLGLIAAGIGALQVVLDKGQRDDWFQSGLIAGFTLIAVVALVAFVVRELRTEHPVVDIRMLGERTFAVSNLMIFVLGFVLYGTTVMLPEFMQEILGYTAETSGMALSPGGFAIMIAMPVVGMLVSRVDSRWLIAFGLCVTALATYHMSGLNLNVDFWTMARYRIFQSLGIGFLFIPINTMAYVGLPPEKNNQVSGMINLFRNIGGSVGISMVTTMLARSQQAHQDALSIHTNHFNPAFNSTVNALGESAFHAGASHADALHRGLAQFYGVMQQQAATQAYISIFSMLALMCVAIAPFVFLMKKNQPGKGLVGAH
ncbi:MAG TPA: DHA2 family efflux MFS transporter permease subunit [Candidatus Binataceae bacterium]|nr:DHA2 family efflux MFS transporter permease subunit [Candidatus Binataceae bacterium]